MSKGPFVAGQQATFYYAGYFTVTIKLRQVIKTKHGNWTVAFLVVDDRGNEYLAGEGELEAIK